MLYWRLSYNANWGNLPWKNGVLPYRTPSTLWITDATFLITRLQRSQNQEEEVGVATLTITPINSSEEFLLSILALLSSTGLKDLSLHKVTGCTRWHNNGSTELEDYRLPPGHFGLIIYANEPTGKKQGLLMGAVDPDWYHVAIGNGSKVDYVQKPDMRHLLAFPIVKVNGKLTDTKKRQND